MPGFIHPFLKYQMTPRISLYTCCFVNIVGVLRTISLPTQWCRKDARIGLVPFKSMPCGKYTFF